MLKIACLIRPRPETVYFVNRIHLEFPVATVVVEKPKQQDFLSRVRRNGCKGCLRALQRKLVTCRRGPDAGLFRMVFGDQWQSLQGEMKVFDADSINSDNVIRQLEVLRPDVVLVHGTSLVKDQVIQTTNMALNLHWGLSPYYRGTHCTEWGLINWDPYNIGVTIHKISRDIDGGDILAQQRAEIGPKDNLQSINAQLTFRGTELILEALRKLNRREDLYFQKQDYSRGYLTYLRQWGDLLDRQIRYIEKHQLIACMLKKPSRAQKLPIVEYPN